ncbi:hypothetical protein LCGC14_2551700, partial [marine sediment metagenome]
MNETVAVGMGPTSPPWRARPVLDRELLEFAYRHGGLTPKEMEQGANAGLRWTHECPGYLGPDLTYGEVIFKLTGYTVILERYAVSYIEDRLPNRRLRARPTPWQLLHTLKPALVVRNHEYFWLRDMMIVLPPELRCKICGLRGRKWERHWMNFDSRYFHDLLDKMPSKHSSQGYRWPQERCCSQRCAVEYLRKLIHLRREQLWLITEGRQLLNRVK